MAPIKIFEYWAMEKPVVTTQAGIGGIPEAEDGENVLIVEDPQAMASATMRLLDNEELAQKLGKDGRRLVLDKYNWKSS